MFQKRSGFLRVFNVFATASHASRRDEGVLQGSLLSSSSFLCSISMGCCVASVEWNHWSQRQVFAISLVLHLHSVKAGVGTWRERGLQCLCTGEQTTRARQPSSQVFCSGLVPAKYRRITWASVGGWLLGGLKQGCMGKQVSMKNTGVTAR